MTSLKNLSHNSNEIGTLQSGKSRHIVILVTGILPNASTLCYILVDLLHLLLNDIYRSRPNCFSFNFSSLSKVLKLATNSSPDLQPKPGQNTAFRPAWPWIPDMCLATNWFNVSIIICCFDSLTSLCIPFARLCRISCQRLSWHILHKLKLFIVVDF